MLSRYFRQRQLRWCPVVESQHDRLARSADLGVPTPTPCCLLNQRVNVFDHDTLLILGYRNTRTSTSEIFATC
jgi:hypothetical protein